MRSGLDFFKESIKNLKTVGSVARSSSFLCKAMIEPIDFSKKLVLVELGPGDGVITDYILDKMTAESTLIAIEVNEVFCEKLKLIPDKRLIVVNLSAEHLDEILKQHGFEHCDAIISAVPFVVLPEDVTARILNKCKFVLVKRGLFVQYHYSLFLKKLYFEIFGNIETDFVPINIPPAFVFTCRK
jgi:phospholipid N-methyltransferase